MVGGRSFLYTALQPEITVSFVQKDREGGGGGMGLGGERMGPSWKY